MSAWPTLKLRALATFRNGLNFAADARGKGLAIVGVRDFQDRSFVRYDELEELNPSALSSRDSLIAKNDIIFVRSNGNRDLIGRSLFVSEAPPMATSHSGFTIRLRLNDQRALPLFFAYQLRGDIIRKVLSSKGGGTNINNLSQGILGDLDVTLPPLWEQQRIADILGAYDDLIQVNRRRVALLDDMARSLFEEWFVRLRFTSQPISVDEAPKGWSKIKVGDALKKFSRPEKVQKRDYVDAGSIPCIDQGASLIGGYTENNAALINYSLPLCVFGDHTRIVKYINFPFASGADGTQILSPIDRLSSEYLYFAIRKIDLSNHHYARHFKLLKAEEIWLPDTETIKKFTLVTRPIMGKIQNLRFQNDVLARSRDLLLPRLISGQLSVAKAERELAQAA